MIRRAVLAAVVGLSAVFAFGAGALPHDPDRWARYDSEHFTIFSNADAERAETLARDLEMLRAAIGRVTGLQPASPVPTHVFLFADGSSMRAYKHLWQGEPASLSGAYYGGAHADFLTINARQPREARWTLFHEYVHTVLRNNFPGLPLWLDEGLAELFASFVVQDGVGVLGRAMPRHLNPLGRQEPISLEELLAVDQTSPRYNAFEHQGEFYTQSWALVHYLWVGDGGERRRQALDFVGRTFAGDSIEEAFVAAFGGGFDVLERELRAYRASGFAARRIPLGDLPQAAVARHALAEPELLVALGELLAAQGDTRRDDALWHFERALELNPKSARALVGLGLVAQQRGDWSRARALYSQALDRRDEALAHYLYGSSLLIFGRGTRTDKLVKARAHLHRSLALDPSFVPAWVQLTEAYALAEQAVAGSGRRLENRPMPPGPDIALQMMVLYTREGQRGAAERLVDLYFEPRADTAELAAARRLLEQMDWLSARAAEPPDSLLR